MIFELRQAVAGAFLALCVCLPAAAANITIVKDELGDKIIDISGRIENGDALKIKQLSSQLLLSLPATQLKGLHFHLDTGGGDFDEAIRIGRFFREVLASVDSDGAIVIAPGSDDEKRLLKGDEPWRSRVYRVAPAGTPLRQEQIVRNYSAGILIFYGAVQRSHRDNVDQRLGAAKQEGVPVMGIHRPYFARASFAQLSPKQAAEAYQGLERTVRAYLAEMGAPQALVDRMFKSSSNMIELVPAAEFRTFYQGEESFLEEWLIAKCGIASDYNNATSGSAQGSGIGDQGSGITGKTRSVDQCKERAVTAHQLAWARSFQKSGSR